MRAIMFSHTKLAALTGGILLLTAGAGMAHHGWGSYDAANPVTISGAVVVSNYQNPHAIIEVQDKDQRWVVVLAPVSRMQNRGATAEMVAVGKTVSAYGYASKVEKNEMRAERLTADGKSIEMR